ncbi:MAG: hypothetical protein WA634_11280 [Silvibacterium sp.]
MNDANFVKEIPIFINVRDRLNCLSQLLSWLERAGHQRIIIIDNASTYPPLLAFLETCPHRVLRLKKNLGHTALWRIPEIGKVIAKSWFVYTDPDVVPIEACPFDLVTRLHELLEVFPCYLKAGPGLCLYDIPDHYHLRQQVIDFEKSLYGREIAPDVFQADIDTTFALHRPHTPYILGPALRLRGRYEARHLPWYVDSHNPDEEERYYRDHAAKSVTNWNTTSDEVKLKCLPLGGGVAREMETDPESLLRTLMRTNSGKMFSIICSFKAFFLRRAEDSASAHMQQDNKARQKILDILLSNEWMAAANIVRRFNFLKR